MLLYFGNQVDATSTGKMLVEVKCERCGCDYAYFLDRVGKSVAEAPYGIGSGWAKRRAEQGAQVDLARRLTTEADLVPCPQCNWINESLIEGYRRSRYRSWGRNVAAFAFVGISCCVIAWYYISRHPGDEPFAVKLLTFGTAGFLAFVGAVLGLRSLLRRAIRPNATHPSPPRIPVGSPPALLSDPATSMWTPVWNAESAADDVDGWVSIQIGRDKLPRLCCDCAKSTDRLFDLAQPIDEMKTLMVPQCKGCRNATSLRRVALFLAVGVIGPLLAAVYAHFANYDSGATWAFVSLSVIPATCVGGWLASFAFSPFRVSWAPRPNGALRIRFKNHAYATAVRQHLLDQLSPRRHAIADLKTWTSNIGTE